MFNWKREKVNILKSSVICSLTLCLTSLSVYSYDAFTPPLEAVQPITIEPQNNTKTESHTPNYEQDAEKIYEEQIASNTIHLDASQVNQALLNGLFPTPSEYKNKKNLQVDKEFSPMKNLQSELKRTDEEQNKPVQTNSESDFSFTNIDAFAPPSTYVKPVKQTIPEPLPPAETIVEEAPATYHASAHSEEHSTEFEGKIVQGITVNGLNLLDEKEVLSVVSTKNGSEFHAYELQKDLQAIFNLGYFSDLMDVDPVYNEGDDTVSLVFNLKENPEIKDVEIKGNSVIPTNEIAQYTKNLKNLPQNLLTINEAIENINAYYASKGYVLEKVSNIDDSSNGILTFEISEGVIEKIEFVGEHKTKDYIIERNMITTAGSVYNEETLKKDISRIYATQIFENIDRTVEPSTDKEGEYVLKISVKEASSNSISIGAGIDNALGVFGSLSVMEKNLGGRAQQLGASAMIGSGLLMSDASIKNHVNYQAEIFFKEPHFINADNSLLSKIYLRELGSYQIPLAIERRFGFNGVVTHKVRGNDKLTTNLGIGYENIHLSEGDYNKIYDMYKMRNLDFSKRSQQLIGGNFINFAPSIEYRNLDNEFMPRDGIIANASFVESLGVDNMNLTNGRLAGKITKYIPVFKKSTLSLTARGGIKVHGNEMPEVMSFALGGPYTIRGFRMNGVGTGDSFLMGSAELQTPIPFMDKFKYDVLKNLRFAFFVDAGKIYDPTISSKLFDRPNSAIVAGVGLRVNIHGIGPISIDYGLPFTHVGQYNSKNGYFTFGTGGLYDSY